MRRRSSSVASRWPLAVDYVADLDRVLVPAAVPAEIAGF